MPEAQGDSINPLVALWRSGTAKEFYERLQMAIEDAMTPLAEDQSIVLVSVLPSGEHLFVEKLGYFNPNLLTLYCRGAEGDECTLFLHPTNVTLLLRVVTLRPDEPKRPLGFVGGKD